MGQSETPLNIEHPPSDAELVQSVLNGDHDGFRLLIIRYEKRIRHFCRARIRESEVDDLVQEIFLRAFRSLKTFQLNRNFGTWLFTIASNLMSSWKFRFKQEMDKIRNLSFFFPPGNSENEGEHNLESEAVRRAVQMLSPGNRDVVELYYFGGLEVDQICEVLSLTASTVKTRLFRSRKELKNIFSAVTIPSEDRYNKL